MTFEEALRDVTHYIAKKYYEGENALGYSTLQFAEEALEKQIAKKPLTTIAKIHFYCPNCAMELVNRNYGTSHCCKCGQKIQW